MDQEQKSHTGIRLTVKRKTDGEIILVVEKRGKERPKRIFCKDSILHDVDRDLLRGLNFYIHPRGNPNSPRHFDPDDDLFIYFMMLGFMRYGFDVKEEEFFLDHDGEYIT